MKFHEALKIAQDTGIGIFRPSWNGNRDGDGATQFVAVSGPMSPLDDGRSINNPFFYISQPGGNSVWAPSTGDLFADDWATL